MSDIINISIGVFLAIAILIVMIVNKSEEAAHDYRAMEQMDQIKKDENIRAVVLCQCESSLPRIPQGDLCYLIADNEKLMIKTKSEPIMYYELFYDKLYLFKKVLEKKARPEKYDSRGTEEYTVSRIIIQYVDDDGSIKELEFLYGDTEEDKAFNKLTFMKNENIYTVVNQMIPQRGNRVTL